MSRNNSVSASKVAYYFKIYCAFLLENGLADDSKTIKVPDLIYYVEQFINEDQQIQLMDDKNLISTFTINHN